MLKTYNGNTESFLEKEKAVNELTEIVERWMRNVFDEWKGNSQGMFFCECRIT